MYGVHKKQDPLRVGFWKRPYRGFAWLRCSGLGFRVYWVAVKELHIGYYLGGTILTTIYIYIPILHVSSLTATQFSG